MSISIYLWNADCYTEATKCPSLTSYMVIKSKQRSVRNSANQRLHKRVQGLQNSLSHATLAWENRGRKRCVLLFSQFRSYCCNILTSFSTITKLNPLHGSDLLSVLFTAQSAKQKSFCNNESDPLKQNLLTAGLSFILLFISWKDIEMLFEFLAAQAHQRTAYKQDSLAKWRQSQTHGICQKGA